MEIADRLKAFGLDKALSYLEKDPEANLPKLMDWADWFAAPDVYPDQRRAFRETLRSKNNWYRLIMRTYELDPGVRNAFFKNFILNAGLIGWPKQEENRKKYGCNIPWTILLDPTSACNLHCTGCWAAEYGNRLNLDFDTIDSIIRQGKELGTYMYIYTGGEPLVRKKDMIRLCEKHPDCEFLCFTNGTLIDKAFCEELLRVKNFIPAISVEGFEEETDARRGKGTYAAVVRAMKLMREHKLAFGISCCYTSANADIIASEAYFDRMIEWGALFCWFFTYMPIGVGAPTDLITTAEQRENMYHAVRRFRETKPLFTMDFWNDGEYVEGCIAGGRRYLHINAAGDAEPCVFIHYSNANIHEKTLLEALQSPLFMAYHDNQPFNDNMLRPCPVLDNPGRLTDLVNAAKAPSTNLTQKEEADDLCSKCVPAAQAWAPVADRLWKESREEKCTEEEKCAG